MQHINTVELLMNLVAQPSITPKDAGCQEIIAKRLEKIGFDITFLPSGKVTNMFAIKGKNHPILAFAGHTDVVPAGELSDWDNAPFEAIIKDNYMYGRGTSDMKGAIAAMITAVERFVEKYPNHPQSIAFLITSDEEGEAIDGTKKIMEYLYKNNIILDACIVGEPTCHTEIGDTIKIGRRGSLTGVLTINGTQGHVAYPKQAKNPIPLLANAINLLTSEKWDEGNKHFPATTFEISNIYGGTGADNVIPGHASIVFNLRFSTEQTESSIKKRIENILNNLKFDYTIQWEKPCLPFLTEPGQFISCVQQAIYEKTGRQPSLSTDGGTSDGRFIASKNTHVIEFGLRNNSIHSANEHIHLDELYTLTNIYERILEIVQLKL